MNNFQKIFMIIFALATNMIVTSMLLLGGAYAFEDVTGMSKIICALIIPIMACWIYCAHGGLRGTFLASYIHTVIIFLSLVIFSFGVYAGDGGTENLWGSAGNIYKAVEKSPSIAIMQDPAKT